MNIELKRNADKSPVSTKSYGYSSGWGDMLTSYDGTEITYDAIGNPLNYYTGQAFSWQGRQLVGVVDGSNTYSFTYNDEGIRTSKTKNGVTTTYYLNGAQIMAEETNGNITVYIYDASGTPIGMQYHASTDSENVWTTYWYEKNLFGDIVAVYGNDGTKRVSYTYDAWGNFTITIHSDEADEMPDNPFTYRGYYYDTDLDLYYLQTRYYDSVTGRFISPDTESVITATPEALTDKNLYAYCDNNPVMRGDSDGEFWNIVVGALVGGGLELAGQLLSGKSWSEVNWAKVGVSAASGGLSAAVGPIAGTLMSGATDVALDALNGNINSVGDVAKSFVWGATKSLISYGAGTLVGKATKSLTKIEKIGKLGNEGYLGIKYSYNKGAGRAVRSIEIHPRHNGHGIHLQGNKWNPKTGTRSGTFFRWTLWR